MKESVKKSFWFNLLVVLLLCSVLYVLFFTSLHWITRHGEEVKIPDVKGKDIKSAVSQLEDMHFDVYVDSTYEPKEKPFTVLKQVPDIGSIVKTGRTIFLTVNKAVPPQTPMPSLVNLSFRSAEMVLRSNKLLVGDTTFKPDIAAGAVLQQMLNGKDIKPGDMIAQGSKIDLVIGDGLGITQFNVPDVTGMSYDEGITLLKGTGLQTTVRVDAMNTISDTASAIIVDQTPRAVNEAGSSNRIKAGDIVDLLIEQNPPPEHIHNNDPQGTVNNVN